MGDLTANFSRHEFACEDECGFDEIDLAFVAHLQVLRDYIGIALHVNSGCRCPARNAATPGAKPTSQHVKALAADVWARGLSSAQLARIAWHLGFGGVKAYTAHCHVDDRTGPRWSAGFEMDKDALPPDKTP